MEGTNIILGDDNDLIILSMVSGLKNFYMKPELAARGLLLIDQFYNPDGSKKYNEDIRMSYPDLSEFKVYDQ